MSKYIRLNESYCFYVYIGVSKNRGFSPKMDGLFHGKPYEQMDDLRVFPDFWKHPYRYTMTEGDYWQAEMPLGKVGISR